MTFLIDVDVGLYVGIGFVLLTIILRASQIRFTVECQIPDSELFPPKENSKNSIDTHPIFVLKWNSPIYFASLDSLSDAIRKGIHPPQPDDKNLEFEEIACDPDSEYPNSATDVILDLSSVSFIDTAGVKFIRQTASELSCMKISFLIAGCPGLQIFCFISCPSKFIVLHGFTEKILRIMRQDETLSKIIEKNAFLSVIDAMTAIKSGKYQFWIRVC